MKVLLSLFIFFCFVIVFPLTTLASSKNNITRFPKCPSPGGVVVASYDEGWHWIAGEPFLRWGSDQVSKIDDKRFVQCYCPLDGSIIGIQTNWLPAQLVPAGKHQNALAKGWIWIQNGADFGLESVPYFALNTNFNCKPFVSVCKLNLSQSNITNISNSIKSIVNTGLNFITGGTGSTNNIQTGNASSQINIVNSGGVNILNTSIQNATHSSTINIFQNNNTATPNP